jgi:hypothetical protein
MECQCFKVGTTIVGRSKNSYIKLLDDAIILLYDHKMGSMKSIPVVNIGLILKYEVIQETPK